MLVITVFCLGLFMTLLDITIVNIAIPDLVTDLNATLETVLWVGSAYSLTYTVLLITAGRLGDIYGPRRLFLIGLTVFTAASLASGLSQTPGQLIAFRALQGVGAALLAPQGLPIITSILPAAKRGPAFAATGIMSGLGVLLGPTLGGFIVTNVGWRWIFFLNIPIGVDRDRAGVRLHAGRPPGCAASARHPRRRPADRRPVRGGLRTDRGRAVRLGHHRRLRDHSDGDRRSGACLLGLFLWRQFRTQDAEPLLPFAVFTDRTFTVMTLVLLAMGFAMVGVFLPMTIYYQSVLGLTAVAAGLVIGTQSLAMMITSGCGRRALRLRQDQHEMGADRRAAAVRRRHGLRRLRCRTRFRAVGVRARDWSPPGSGSAACGSPVFGLATRDMPPSRAGHRGRRAGHRAGVRLGAGHRHPRRACWPTG